MTEDQAVAREELLRQRLEAAAAQTAARPAEDRIRPVPRGVPVTLSWAQRRIWILEQLQPGSTEYLTWVALRLTGPLDHAALRRALDGIVRDHETLRTRYAVVGGEPVGLIDPPAPVPLRRVDLRAVPAEDRDRGVADQIASDGRSVDLASGPVFVATLIALADDEHVLALTTHHIATDEWSEGVIQRELAQRYAAGEATSAGTAAQVRYADFAAWQRQRTAAGRDRSLGYWRDQLDGVAPLALPTDRPRPPVRDPRGAAAPFTVPAPVADAVRALARERRATPFMVTLAAFQVLLARLCGQNDVAVGVPATGRDRAELWDVVGLFLNTLVLRADLSGRPSFTEAVDRARATAVDAFDHQDLPFEYLVDALAPQRDPSHNPLFSTMFVWHDPETTGRACAGALTVQRVPVSDTTAKVDLTLSLAERPDGSLDGAVVFATALFDSATAVRIAERYVNLLTAAAAAPHLPVDALDLLDDADRRVVAQANDTAVPWPAATVPDLIAAQAQATPDAVAVVSGETTVSYADLSARSNRTAHYLRHRGVGPETVVGVRLERGVDLVVALLAVWKAGGVYLPLDPDLPAGRIDALVAASGAHLVITGDDLAAAEGQPDHAPEPGIRPDNAAYLIFTSGSTGAPKGVVGTHQGIVNRVRWMQKAHRLDARDRVLQKTPIGFDVSLWEFLWPLTTGAAVVAARPGGHRDPRRLAEEITGRGVTVVHFVPSMLRAFLAEPFGRPPALRLLVCSGEALTADLVAAAHDRLGCEVHNLYGPTEASVDVTAAQCVPGASVTLGGPIANTRVYVVDGALQPVPVGVPGELVLAGVQLARGYHGQPAATADRFVPDPFGEPGARLYRTGDRARLRGDGALEYLGRLDRQIKINGHRVEPGEVEAALAAHPAVTAAAVTVHDGRLAAYVSPSDADVTALREHLRGLLPEPMVPARWTALGALPLTAGGKVDYAALPAAAQPLPTGYVAPRNALEQLVAATMADAIGLATVGVHDGFFALGGDSMRAIRVVGELRAAGIDLAVHDLFTHQTTAELAVLATERGIGARSAAVAPFAQLTAEDRDLVPDGVVDAYPVAETQAGMLYEMLAATDATIYQNVSCYRVRDGEPFSIDALRKAVRIMVERHEILRTGFDLSTYSEPLQLVHTAAELPVGYQDLRDMSEDEQRAAARAYRVAERGRLLDITAPSLVRHQVHRMGEGEWWLTHTECHAVLDGWSQTAFVAELLALYRSLRDGKAPAPAPPPAVRFADFVAAERRSMESEEDRDFWASVLDGQDKLEVPAAWAGPGDGEPIVVRVPIADLEPRLRALAAATGASFKSVLHTAHLKALSVATGRRRFFTGLVANGRPEVAGADRVPGMYLNTVPFAADTVAATWRELVASVFAAEARLWPHRWYPMPAMMRDQGTSTPLVDFAFVHLDFHVLDWNSTVDLVDDFSPSELPLIAITFPGLLHLHARSDRVDRAKAEMLARTYRYVLEAMAADPDADPAAVGLAPADRDAALSHGTVRAFPTDRMVHQLIAEHAAATPDAVAIVQDEEALSFAELDRRANRLARRLVAHGVGPETLVGLHLAKSPDLVVAQLATLKAGGAFVAMDPELPESRLRHLIDDAAPRVVLTTAELRARVPGAATPTVLTPGDGAGMPETAPDDRATPASLAYLLYTSGSTGRPKGVAVPHGPLLNLLHATREHIDVQPGDQVLQFSAMSFDVSVWEALVALSNGATLVLPSRGADPGDLRAQAGRVTHMSLPPAMLAYLTPSDFPRLRVLVSAGEALPGDEAARWAGHARLINAYGPTEATVYATLAEVPAGSADPWPPIGFALGNTSAYVLDAHGAPVPDGVRGELFLAGAGVTRGYFGRPAVTADRFVPDPFARAPGARMYRTGDVVSRAGDGALRYHGRGDQQVKVRGFRIELGEVEQALVAHPRVDGAVVTVHRPGTQDAALVAYTWPSCGPTPAQLREHLRIRLPRHMVPARYVGVDQVPLTVSGKIDRAALPAPDDVHAAERVAPRTALERAIAQAWAETLHIDEIGIHDDFFDLGGHSLAMMRIITRLRETEGLKLTLRSFLEQPTIARLVAQLGGEPGDKPAQQSSRALVWLRRQGTRAPLFCVHPGGGSAHWYRRFLPHLDRDLPVAAFEWPDLPADAEIPPVAELAGRHYAELREARPHGPYRLFAWCGGSAVAAELAGRLIDEGETVTFMMLDPVLDAVKRPNMLEHSKNVRRLEYLVNLIAREGEQADTPENRAEIIARYNDVETDVDEDVGMDLPERGVGAAWPRTVRVWRETMDAIVKYPHRRVAGKLHLLASDDLAAEVHIVVSGQTFGDYVARWRELAAEGVDVHRVPGTHAGVMKPPRVANVCAVVGDLIAHAEKEEAR